MINIGYKQNVLQKLNSLLRNEFVSNAMLVFFGTTIAGSLNLLYQLISVRILTTKDYGTFYTLITIIAFTSMAFSPLGVTFTRFFTEYITKKNFSTLIFILKKLIKRAFIGAFLSFFICIVASSAFADFLKTGPFYIIICGGIIGLSLFALPAISLFQSFQKFKIYSLIGISSVLGKLVIGVIFMLMGWGVLGGLLGYLATPILIILIALLLIPNILKKEIGCTYNKDFVTANLVPIYKYFLPVSVTMLSFTSLTSIDVILVKHFFSSLHTGYYSIAQMVGKIFIFFPSALAIVIFPKSTKAYVNNSHSDKILDKSLLFTAFCCALGCIFCLLYPGFVLHTLTGKINPESLRLVGLFSIAGSFYALLWILINYLLATHSLKFVIPLLILALLQAASIYVYHASLLQVARLVMSFSFLSFSVTFFIARVKNN